jgi:hypothetical protein
MLTAFLSPRCLCLFRLSCGIAFSPAPPLPHSNCNLIRFALLVFSPSHATFTFPRLAAFGAAVADHCHARIFLPSFSAIYSSSGGDQHYRSSLLPPPAPFNSLMYCM